MIVIGVRSSWPASETNSRWLENAASRRSSIALNVRPSSAISSSPSTSIRCVRSLGADRPRGGVELAQRRQHAAGDHEAEHGHEQQHGERDARGDLDGLGDVGGVLRRPRS